MYDFCFESVVLCLKNTTPTANHTAEKQMHMVDGCFWPLPPTTTQNEEENEWRNWWVPTQTSVCALMLASASSQVGLGITRYLAIQYYHNILPTITIILQRFCDSRYIERYFIHDTSQYLCHWRNSEFIDCTESISHKWQPSKQRVYSTVSLLNTHTDYNYH